MSNELNNPQNIEEIPTKENIVEVKIEKDIEQTQSEEVQHPVENQIKEDNIDYSALQDEAQATNILKDKGFEYKDLQEEYETTGNISKETREKLAEVGISNDVVDSFIEGRKVLIEKAWDDIASAVGGREQMQQVIEWAKQNLTEEEKFEYDAIHSPNAIKSILRDLNVRMKEVEGAIPQQITGSGGNISDKYFQSMAEVEAAINDPRYSKDEVYRENVGRKILASREAGVIFLS